MLLPLQLECLASLFLLVLHFILKSCLSSVFFISDQDEDHVRFHSSLVNKSRPACFEHEFTLRNSQLTRRLCDSVLGLVS